MLRPSTVLRRVIPLAAWLLLASCTTSSGTPIESPITPGGPNSTPTATSESNNPTDTPSEPPTESALPPYTYSLQAKRVPATGNLLVEGGRGAEFLTGIGELPAGDYLLLADGDTGEISAFSIGSGLMNPLLQANLEEDEGVDYGDLGAFFDLGIPAAGPSLRIYDLQDGSWLEVRPSCHVLRYSLSPGGKWIGTICDPDGPLQAASADHVVLEAVSIPDGVGIQLQLPHSPSGRNLPTMVWLDDGIALVSSVWIDDQLRACAVFVEEPSMYCPPLGLESLFAIQMDLSPGAESIPLFVFGSSPRAALAPRQCFDVSAPCPGITEVQVDQPVSLLATSDPEIVWWIEGLGPDPTSEMGIVDLEAAGLRQLASLDGDYSPRAVCSDGRCLFVYDHGGGTNWRINLDGTLEALPVVGDLVIAAFHIP